MMGSRRLAVYFFASVCFIAGLFTGRSFLFNIAYLLLGLLLVAFLWALGSVHWIGIDRKTRARRAQVGKNLDEVFTVRNTWLIPKLWLEVRDHSTLPAHNASQIVPAIAPRGQHRWYVKTACLVRGEFRMGPMTLRSGDPFGLFNLSRVVPATSQLIVYPAIVPITKFELPMGVLSGGEAQRQITQFVTTNAVGVREYVPGDSFNRIHWRSSARKNNLMVKEFELDPLVDIHLFVDFSAYSIYEAPSVRRLNGNGTVIPSSQNGIPASTEEYTVVVAASLARAFIDAQRALGFSAYTPARQVLGAERGERQFTRIIQTLATARSFSPYTLAQMLTLESQQLARGTTLVIVTASTQPEWTTEVQILARKGIKPMCVFIDPNSFGAMQRTIEIISLLQISRIPVIPVNYRDDLTNALAQRPL